LHYLIITKNLAIEFDSTTIKDQVFLIYSNIAFADNKNAKYRSNKYTIKLFGGIIHFKAIKQKIVITISIKAKLLAFTFMAKEYMW